MASAQDFQEDARGLHEDFLVSFPTAEDHGLWILGDEFVFAVAAEESTLAAMRAWMSSNCPAHLLARVETAIPADASQVDSFTLGESLAAKENEAIVGLALSRSPTIHNAAVRRLWEEDLDVWRAEREAVYAGSAPTQSVLPPGVAMPERASCVVNAAHGAHDLRNYVCVYDHVHVVLPRANRHESALAKLGASESQLLQLIELGKVSLLLQDSVELYEQSFLGRVADEYPDRVVLSRRLALGTLLAIRDRAPLLFAPMTMDERRSVLGALAVLAETGTDENLRKYYRGSFTGLQMIWRHQIRSVPLRGARGVAEAGVATLLASLAMELQGRDVFLELWGAASTVEFAAALDATAIPAVSDTYSERAAAELIACVYNGARRQWVVDFPTSMEVAIESLLSVDQDVDVVTLAQSFHSGDIARFRRLLHDLLLGKGNVEEVRRAAAQFNEEVRRYEGDVKRLRSWKLDGLAGAGVGVVAVAAGADPVTAAAVTGLPWLASQATRGLLHLAGKNPVLGAAVDAITALAMSANPRVVLVARMKSSLPKS